jgi:uncharacterized protein
MSSAIIQLTADYVKQKLSGEGSGHDWWHVYRVWQNAKLIGAGESIDMQVVELAALLHDIADYKFHKGDTSVGPRTARSWLKKQGVEAHVVEHVIDIIGCMSFSSGLAGKQVTTREGMVVQDADRLDAIGAIGIARCFAYGGSKGHEMHNPEKQPTIGISEEDYKKDTGTQINHFYEKLLLLKDRMNTKTAKAIAQHRHEFMKTYLDEFFAEWEGKR